MLLKKTLLCFYLCLTAGAGYSVNPEETALHCQLEYHIIGKAQSSMQSASQYLTPQEEIPKDIKDLPRNIGRDLGYFTVRLGKDDICILLDSRPDNSKEPYVLYIDSDGDKSFSGEKAYPAYPIKPGWFGRNDQYRFGPVRVELGADPDKLNIIFHITMIDGERLSIYPCRYRRGKIQLGDYSYIVSVIDGNFDGRYEISKFTNRTTPAGMDSIEIFGINTPKTEQRYTGLIPLTRIIRIRNDFFNINLAPDGGTLDFAPASLNYGTLTISGNQVAVRLWSDIAAQTLSGAGPWKLPEGQYKALAFEIFKKDNQGNTWSLEGSTGKSRLQTIDIQPEQTTTFPLGEPIQIKIYVKKS